MSSVAAGPIRSSGRSCQFSDEAVMSALREASLSYGRNPLTGPRYERWAATQRSAPSAHLISMRFGWVHACELAGVASIESARSVYVRRWTDQQMRSAVSTFLAWCETHGMTATYRKFVAWCDTERAEGREVPSAALVRVRLGRWADVVNGLRSVGRVSA